MKSFITGSRAYGTPRPDSDTDLVCLVDDNTAYQLAYLSDQGKSPIRFGSLNLILVFSEKEFFAWQGATEELVNRKNCGEKITREEAIKVIDSYYDLLKIARREGMSEDATDPRDKITLLEGEEANA